MLVIPYYVIPYNYILSLSDNRALFRPLCHHPFRCEKKRQWGGVNPPFSNTLILHGVGSKNPIISHEVSHQLPI